MRLKIYNSKTILNVDQFKNLPENYKTQFSNITKVFAFRTNNYVIEQLIDWDNAMIDPIFKINFFPDCSLTNTQLALLSGSSDIGNIEQIRHDLNPDADYNSYDVPKMQRLGIVEGVQHKFEDICIVFPKRGQQCHSYCTFCFRWAQFIDVDNSIAQYSTNNNFDYLSYVRVNDNLKEVLFTGGDPLFMSTKNIIEYISPLLNKEYKHIETIRIGTKSLSFWPYRFVTDYDADNLIKFFELIVNSGKHLAIMAHFNHWRELDTSIVQKAIKRIQNTGAVIRTQSPLLKGINDSSDVWSRMLNEQIKLGCIPYYMLVERRTGANNAYSIPLMKALEIFKDMAKKTTGLAKTIRGPVMSTFYGKIAINDLVDIGENKYFLLSFIRSRNPDYVGQSFFARYDENATWLSDLKPLAGEKFFFQ